MTEDIDSLAARCDQLLQQGDLAGARELAERIIRSGARLKAVHHNLVGVVRVQSGDLPGAIECFERARKLRPDSAQYARHLGWAQFLVGRRFPALRAMQDAVRLNPKHAQGHWLLGYIQQTLGNQEAAHGSYTQALTLEPKLAPAAAGLLSTLLGMGRRGEAREAVPDLLRRFPDDGALHVQAAHALIGTDPSRAAECIRTALSTEPPTAAALDAVLALGLDDLVGEAIERARLLAGQNSAREEDRISALYALGNLFDRENDPDTAFEWLAEANRKARDHKKRIGRLNAPEWWAQRLDDIRGNFPLDRIAVTDTPANEPQPLCILGLPRSGKSSIERILARHSLVAAGYEQTYIGDLIRTLEEKTGASHTELLRDGDGRLDNALQRARKQRNHDAAGMRYQTDTKPAHLRLAGLVAVAWPGARFIFVHRDRLDTGFSIYAKQFPNMDGWDTDLEDIARGIRYHETLTAFWTEHLGDRVLNVHYEDLVRDEPGTVARILEFAGLDPEPALAPPDTAGRSLSPAHDPAERVRLDDRFIGIAERYRHHLAPLATALGEAP